MGPGRRLRSAVLGAVLASVVAIGVFHYATSAAPRSVGTASIAVRVPDGERLQRVGRSGPDAADGVLPGAVSVFSNAYAGITRLNPRMLAALRRAATEARRYGIAIDADSGWRSRAYQEELFDQAVAQYGSAEAAARWVARPGTSIHEAGDAVDIAGADAEAWLWRNGAAYGLCRMYGNEVWHFEWRPAAVADGCPAMYVDPTHDPRLGK